MTRTGNRTTHDDTIRSDTIYNVDCVRGMRRLPARSVDLVITDPPFAIEFKARRANYHRTQARVLEGYSEVPRDRYYDFTLAWMREVRRVLKTAGSMYVFSGWNNLKDILAALDAAGFTTINHIIWKYQFGVVTRRRFVSSHYHCLYVCKDDRKRRFYPFARYRRGARDDAGRSLHYRDKEDVWLIKREYWHGDQKTPTKLPRELIEKLLAYSSRKGDLVLDPFLGSGQVAVVSKMMGRRYVGYEIVKDYYDFASRRLATGQYRIPATAERKAGRKVTRKTRSPEGRRPRAERPKGKRQRAKPRRSLRPLLAVLAMLATGALLPLACCHTGKPAPPSSVRELPQRIGESGWMIGPETNIYAGRELYEYIDGAAEMYLKYAFVEVTATEYEKGDRVITTDIYRFADSDRAFGMYTTLRPDQPDTVAYGAEGFAFWPNLVFVSGPYLANVYGYDDSDETISGLRAVSGAIERSVGGASDKPTGFNVFPAAGRLPFTEKIYAEAFLGRAFLADVYAVDYSAGEASGENRFTLFTTDDADSAKFDQWRSGIAPGDAPAIDPATLPAGIGDVLVTSDPDGGAIVTGLRAGKLVGMVGFRPELTAELAAWLQLTR